MLGAGSPKARTSREVVEVLCLTIPKARLSRLNAEVLTQGTPKARLSRLSGEVLTQGTPKARLSRLSTEVLCGAPPLTVTLVGDGALTAAIGLSYGTSAALDGSSAMTANVQVFGTTHLDGTSGFTAATSASMSVAAALSGVGDLLAGFIATEFISATLVGETSLHAHVNPAPSGWVPTTDAPTLVEFGKGGTIGGSVYHVTAGNDHWGYDASTATWTAFASPPSYMSYHSGCVLDDKLYISGGIYSPTLFCRYDPGSNQWTTLATLPYGYRFHTMAGIGGNVYLFGSNTWCVRYDVSGAAFTSFQMDTVRDELRAVAHSNGKIYVQGGYGYGTLLQEFDPVSMTFTRKADAPHAHGGHALVSFQDQIWAIAGYDNSFALTDWVDAYDPATNTWSTSDTYPFPTVFPFGDVVGGRLLSAGGWV